MSINIFVVECTSMVSFSGKVYHLRNMSTAVGDSTLGNTSI